MKKTNITEMQSGQFADTEPARVLTAALSAARADDRTPAGTAALEAARSLVGSPAEYDELLQLRATVSERLRTLERFADFDDAKRAELEQLRTRTATVPKEIFEAVTSAWQYHAHSHLERTWEAGRARVAALVQERYLPVLEELAARAKEVADECRGLVAPYGCPAVPVLPGVTFASHGQSTALTSYAAFLQQHWEVTWDPTNEELFSPTVAAAGVVMGANQAQHGAAAFNGGTHQPLVRQTRRFADTVAVITGLRPPAA